jgi:hypothetical protein
MGESGDWAEQSAGGDACGTGRRRRGGTGRRNRSVQPWWRRWRTGRTFRSGDWSVTTVGDWSAGDVVVWLIIGRSACMHRGDPADRMVGGDVGDCRRVGLVGGLVGPPGWRRWRTGGDRPVLDRRVSSAAATSGTGRTLNGPAGGDVGGLVGDVGDRDRSVAMSGDWSAATSGDRSEDWSVHPWVATLADWSDRSGTGGGPVGGDVGDWSAATSGGTGRRTGRSSRRRYDSRRAIRRDRWRVDRSAAMSGDRSAATLGTRSEDWSVQRRAAHAGTGQCGDR